MLCRSPWHWLHFLNFWKFSSLDKLDMIILQQWSGFFHLTSTKNKWDHIVFWSSCQKLEKRHVCKTCQFPHLEWDVLKVPYFLNAFQLQGSFVWSFCRVSTCFAPGLFSGDCSRSANYCGQKHSFKEERNSLFAAHLLNATKRNKI